MSKFIVEGGKPIRGTIEPVGNKNAALPMLAACLLTDEPVRLQNVPDIEDVRVMLSILDELGVEISHDETGLTLTARESNPSQPSPELCKRVRSSILLAGPLLARDRIVNLPPPGGDVIGRRRLDTHFLVFSALGATCSYGQTVKIEADSLTGAEILLDEASVTATENAMMAAVFAKGKTILYHAACEPHVVDLGELLCKMGAQIEGLGTNRVIIEGVQKLHGAEHSIGPDYIEAGSFLACAAATGGELTILHGGKNEIWQTVLQRSLQKTGLTFSCPDSNTIVFQSNGPLSIQCDAGLAIPKIEDGPWPAFPSDLMSAAIVVATQAEGSILFFEKMFESRMYFVDRLIEMGARVVQCDPHRVVVSGPSRLHASHMTSPDIRAGMAMITAALCAEGTSVIENAQMIDRGYECIDRRLASLGASISREEN